MTDRKQKEDAIWKATHRDYRGMHDGKRAVLALRERGTTIVPLDEMPDSEIERMHARIS